MGVNMSLPVPFSLFKIFSKTLIFVTCSLDKCNIFKENFRINGHAVQFS